MRVTPKLNRRIRYDTDLKGILTDLGQLCRDYMNHTSLHPGTELAELQVLRGRVGIKLGRLRDEYGCTIRGPLNTIVR